MADKIWFWVMVAVGLLAAGSSLGQSHFLTAAWIVVALLWYLNSHKYEKEAKMWRGLAEEFAQAYLKELRKQCQ